MPRDAATRRVAAAAAAATVMLASALASGSALAAQDSVPAKAARATVVAKAPGQVTSVRLARRQGFTAWAVTVQRNDGSVVVGYVDARSGIIFDWAVLRPPGR